MPIEKSHDGGASQRTVTSSAPQHQVEGRHHQVELVAVDQVPVAASGPRIEPKAILVTRQSGERAVMPIWTNRSYTFGRDRTETVVFAEDSVSRQHGMLTYSTQGCWVYRDLGSTNGSFLPPTPDYDGPIGEVREAEPGEDVRVYAGDCVVLGKYAGRITFLEAVPETPLVAAPRSAAAQELEDAVRESVGISAPVVLLGPSGAGKTFLARRIHNLGQLAGPFVPINCARLPRDVTQLQSELLGHRKGAFTGAISERLGEFFHAENGTLFLDEIDSLSEDAQGFLLDVLEESGRFKPLGGRPEEEPRRPRFRLIAATKVPLLETSLREDLINRLATGVFIEVPSLAARPEDIPAIAQEIAIRLREEQQLDLSYGEGVINYLREQPWTGNVRELEGVLSTLAQLEARRQRFLDAPMDTANHTVITEVVRLTDTKTSVPVELNLERLKEHLAKKARAMGTRKVLAVSAPPPPRREAGPSRAEIERVYGACNQNKTRAAEQLGMAVNTLKKKLKGYGLE